MVEIKSYDSDESSSENGRFNAGAARPADDTVGTEFADFTRPRSYPSAPVEDPFHTVRPNPSAPFEESYNHSPVEGRTISIEEDVPILHVETVNETDGRQDARRAGAGVAAGVIGLLIGGPFLGTIMGFGTAYASDQEGAAGDIARAVGETALIVKERAKDLDEKHHIVDKTKLKVKEGWHKLQELEKEENITEKVKDAIFKAIRATIDFTQRHKLIERGVSVIGKGVYLLSNKLIKKLQGICESQEPQRESQRMPTDYPRSRVPSDRATMY